MKLLLELVVIILAVALAAVAVGGLALPAEQPSPADRTKVNDVVVMDDGVVISLKNARIAVVSDTKSMDPTLDSGSVIIEVPPEGEWDITEGDIITYRSGDKVVVHRVIDAGVDASGWYAVTKGDNNPLSDSERVRFSQVRGIVVGVLW